MPTCLVKLIGEVIPMFQLECETLACRIRYQPDGDRLPVLADALQIQLVLANLLGNALRSIRKRGEGGREIAIDTERLENEEILVSVADQGRAFRRTGYRTYLSRCIQRPGQVWVWGSRSAWTSWTCMAGASGMSRIPAGEPFSDLR